MKDIQNLEDIQAFMNHFYGEAKEDAFLATVFNRKILAEAWPAHPQHMYAFWNALLFAE